MSLSDRRRTMLDAAASEAKRFGHGTPGPLHLAAALERQGPGMLDRQLGAGTAARVIESLRGGDLGSAGIDLEAFLSGCPGETPADVIAALAPFVVPAPTGPPPVPSAPPVPAAIREDDGVPALWSPGDVILDTYEVLAVAGEGGMGRVYRVRHRHWDVELAVKSPRADAFLDDHDRVAFEAEAQRWIELGLHPHICACHYVRRLGGIPRIFAEYAEGGSLADWIDGDRFAGPDGLERMLAIAVQFARGLAFAHERGVVHQDVKPGNVLMSGAGEAKVADFGLARVAAASGAGAIADVRVSLGGMTPAYRSPEQAVGAQMFHERRQPPRLTPATDTWSFAVSVLELFLGELPGLDGQLAGEAFAAFVRTGRRSRRPGLPPMPAGVADVLARCLYLEPSARPAMAEVAAALASVFAQTTGTAFPADGPQDDALLAGELSNRALSMLDLGRAEQATALAARALERDPQHPQATYNQALAQWRRGTIADDEVARRLEGVRGAHARDWIDEYLLGLVHLERGDAAAAIPLLHEAGEHAEVVQARRAAATIRPSAQREHVLAWDHGRVDALAVTPDGTRALLGSQQESGVAQLLDLDSGRVLHTFTSLEPHRAPAAAGTPVALSDDGRLAVVGCLDGTVRVWATVDGRCLRVIQAHPTNVGAVVLTPDGRHLLTWSVRGEDTACSWDLGTGACVNQLAGMGMVTCAAFDPGSGRLLAGGMSSVWLRDPARGGGLLPLGEGGKGALAVALGTGGRAGLVGGPDGHLRLWDLNTARPVADLAGHTGSVLGVALAADARSALTGGLDTTARLWDLDEQRCRRTIELGEPVTALALTPDGRRAVLGTASGRISCWRLDARASHRAPWAYTRPRPALEAMDAERRIRADLAEIDALLDAGDLRAAAERVRVLRAVAGYERHPDVLAHWRRATAHGRRIGGATAWQTAALAAPEPPGGSVGLEGVAVSADGRHGVSVGGASVARLWDLVGGREVSTLEGPRYGWSPEQWMSALQTSVALSRSGSVAVLGSSMGAVQVWDLTRGDCRDVLLGHENRVGAAAVTPDARLALTGGADGSARLWDLDRGACLHVLPHEGKVTSAALAADGGRALTVAQDGVVRVWDLRADPVCIEQIGDGDARCAALREDGAFAVVGGADGTVRAWNVERGAPLEPAGRHDGAVTAVVLSADGGVALTAGADRTACVWHLAGDGPPCLLAHNAGVSGVALGADARVALTAATDGVMRVWELDWDYDVTGGATAAAPEPPPVAPPRPVAPPAPQPVPPPAAGAVSAPGVWTDEQAREFLSRHASGIGDAIFRMVGSGLDSLEVSISDPQLPGAPRRSGLWIALPNPRAAHAWLVDAEVLPAPALPQPAGAIVRLAAHSRMQARAAGPVVVFRGDLGPPEHEFDGLWRELCEAVHRVPPADAVRMGLVGEEDRAIVNGEADVPALHVRQLRRHWELWLARDDV